MIAGASPGGEFDDGAAEVGGYAAEPVGAAGPADAGVLLVDCHTCSVRGLACDDCVIAVLLGGPPDDETGPVGMDPVEVRALHALAGGGLVPPLRLSPRRPRDRPKG